MLHDKIKKTVKKATKKVKKGLGSLITASVGLGGGTLTLATMALLMSPTVLIPIHGVVQLGSNFGRALLLYREIIRGIIPII